MPGWPFGQPGAALHCGLRLLAREGGEMSWKGLFERS
jgi:hypothetical protein